MANNPKNMGLSFRVNLYRSSRRENASKIRHEIVAFVPQRIRYTPDVSYILPLHVRDSTNDGDRPEEHSERMLAVYPDPDVFMTRLLKGR